ncbi:MAG: hypothetical protein KAJ14_11440, partial [Candidatus Omnitrophica bacterium]|nr:hypothetical protein [Candidatus Omnitrophota bacterium]
DLITNLDHLEGREGPLVDNIRSLNIKGLRSMVGGAHGEYKYKTLDYLKRNSKNFDSATFLTSLYVANLISLQGLKELRGNNIVIGNNKFLSDLSGGLRTGKNKELLDLVKYAEIHENENGNDMLKLTNIMAKDVLTNRANTLVSARSIRKDAGKWVSKDKNGLVNYGDAFALTKVFTDANTLSSITLNGKPIVDMVNMDKSQLSKEFISTHVGDRIQALDRNLEAKGGEFREDAVGPLGFFMLRQEALIKGENYALEKVPIVVKNSYAKKYHNQRNGIITELNSIKDEIAKNFKKNEDFGKLAYTELRLAELEQKITIADSIVYKMEYDAKKNIITKPLNEYSTVERISEKKMSTLNNNGLFSTLLRPNQQMDTLTKLYLGYSVEAATASGKSLVNVAVSTAGIRTGRPSLVILKNQKELDKNFFDRKEAAVVQNFAEISGVKLVNFEAKYLDTQGIKDIAPKEQNIQLVK